MIWMSIITHWIVILLKMINILLIFTIYWDTQYIKKMYCVL
jgi:hypothetical protein